jgi:hypothetical protein
MSTENQLVALDDISIDKAPAIYGHNKLTAYVALAREQAANEVPDLTTKKGRDRIASLAAQVSRSKTAVEKPGREYLKRIKEMPKAIEAELREFVNSMDALRDEVRAPLNEWEQAEADRVARHEERVQQLRDFAMCDNLQAAGIRVQIENLEAIVVDTGFEEFEAEAHRVKTTALVMLRNELVKRQQYEAEQTELERLRAEAAQREQADREARIAREAAEQAQREAEQRAQAERDAAAKREADAKAAAEQRELQLKLEAEQSARRELEAQQRAEQAERKAIDDALLAVAEERRRLKEENERIEAEAKAREADKAHKAAINRAALEAFIAGGMPEACAKQAVTLIAKRKIPNIQITY